MENFVNFLISHELISVIRAFAVFIVVMNVLSMMTASLK